jgi:hypothetical protein
MYLRHTTRRKDGKVHTYWRLVRSVRVGRTVRQQTVAHLGELDAQGRARAKALAQAITGGREQPDLFEPSAVEDVPIQLAYWLETRSERSLWAWPHSYPRRKLSSR